jgi:peroxiredoxin
MNRGPMIWSNYQKEGQTLSTREVPLILANEILVFPPSGSAVVIYWATWCAPCKLEMQRLAKSVNEGKIPQDKIFALSLGESKEVVAKFLKKNEFPFTFISDPSHEVNIEVTPSTALLKDGKITSLSSGVSFIGIWRAEALFW